MNRIEAYAQAAAVLPPDLRRAALTLPLEGQAAAEELRLRVGRPLTAVFPEGEAELCGPVVTGGDLERLVEIASRASVHAVLDQMRAGFLTAEGGHRIGLCGTAVLREGEIHSLRQLSSANVRVARQVKGAADSALEELCPGGVLTDTLILSPPGMGKTTLLRDVIRRVSDGEGCVPRRVALADERGEVAAPFNGVPQLDVGRRTDVMAGCPKDRALMILLRAMNPQVLAVDEITAPEDVYALHRAAGCGVTLLATAHGENLDDLRRRPMYRSLWEERRFRRVVRICREGRNRRYEVEVLA